MSTKLKDRESIEQILQEMSLEEKASLVIGGTPFYTETMEKYGIPGALLLDGGTGINYSQMALEYAFQAYYQVTGKKPDKNAFRDGMGGLSQAVSILTKQPGPDTAEQELQVLQQIGKLLEEFRPEGDPLGCYPPGILLGATWNPEVIKACGRELAKETDAHKVDVMLGSPNVNIHRDPRNGRLFEGYSEDPCLVSKLAPEFVKAVQEEGIVANVKHFAANNQETNRMGINEHISERALREIYFPGFKACVDAGCKTVMSAYNQINGRPCAMNKWLLEDVLVKEWGFEGFVVSDWSASYDEAESCAAGNDLIMPGPRETKPLVDAVRSGDMPEEVLDTCIRHFLNVLLEMPVMKGRRYRAICAEGGDKAAYEAAAEGIVLLKNDGILPLNRGTKVSFWGERSKKMVDSGAGSANVDTPRTTSLFACTAGKVGADHVSFETITDETDTVIITVGANGQEGADRIAMDLEAEDKKMLLKTVAEAKTKDKKTIVVLNIAGPVEMMDWLDDVNAVLCVFLPGMQGGQAAADILFGDRNPSGKLPLTFPKYYRDCPTYRSFPGEYNDSWYGEGIYVGYRYYDMKEIEPLYPFGYGLSYTTFELNDLRVPETVNVEEEDVPVQVTVKNTGNRGGAEVVQVYIHDVEASLEKPVKELKAFQKVYLEAGESKTITLKLCKQDFASYDTKLGAWAAEPGAFEILVGNSSRNVSLQSTVIVKCKNPYQIGPDTSIGKLVTNAQAVAVINEAIGTDFLTLVGTAIVFFPGYTLEEIWGIMVDKILPGDEEEKRALKQQVYGKLAKLDEE